MGVGDVQTWLKNAVTGQPAHRDNLGDVASSGGVLQGLSRATLQAAPLLAKQLVAEQSLVQKAQLQNAPRMAPPSLGPGATTPMPGLNNLMPRAPRAPDAQSFGDDNGE